MAKKQLTGIILAGGKSRRMGMEKGLVVFKGQPLIHRAISLFEDICSEILISSNSTCYDNLGYRVVPDLVDDSGPMGGIYSCLKVSKNRSNLIISCDMPFVTEEIFHHLLSQAGNAWISVPWYENEHYEPLCGLYLKDCLPDMKGFIDKRNYKLPELYSNTKFRAAKVNNIFPQLDPYYFMNINTPADLESARNLQNDDLMINLPNWLIVYGTNRNCGKTTLVTRIISDFRNVAPITAIKISPHFHPVEDDAEIILKTDEYIIVKETSPNTGKDSSRMLLAGAEEVFYIQVWDNNLDKVIMELLKIIKPGSLVICESGWARNIINPGVFLILNRQDNPEIKTSAASLKHLASRWIEFDGKGFDFEPGAIKIENGNWKLG